ncbi:MAG: WYL domain-containing protein [Proteobacteria bacterium]|uniref:helix-turn-helix transcriptional regulator n=1 Tax=Acidiphilium angustum TaxID=523 RepID=UPI000A48CE7B|nr:WYL domain-containing protein [Acidiphilium angustum]MBW4034896.1 WYL domain-containing protein [Pseudomonadota bacterium]
MLITVKDGMNLSPSRRAPSAGAVRYEPGTRLVRLAVRLAGSRMGLSLEEMAAELKVGRRTAERLRDRLEEMFPQLAYTDDENRVRRWRLPRETLPALPAQPGAIATIETLARELAAKGDDARAADLRDAAATLRAMMTPVALRRSEPDIEALMQAEGTAASPGPRLKLDRGTLTDLRTAILGMHAIELKYRPAGETRTSIYILCPYGILYGRRAYLVARKSGSPDMRLWRIDRISDLLVLPECFRRHEFDLAAYAAQSFGVFQEPPRDVVLRFSADAAEDAAAWVFHPSQQVEPQADGSLLVRLRCGGMRELGWHLHTWGDAVEVLAGDVPR